MGSHFASMRVLNLNPAIYNILPLGRSGTKNGQAAESSRKKPILFQGHQVKVPVESVHREEVLYKVWWLKALQLRTYGRVT